MPMKSNNEIKAQLAGNAAQSTIAVIVVNELGLQLVRIAAELICYKSDELIGTHGDICMY